jgi:hypothetical protein
MLRKKVYLDLSLFKEQNDQKSEISMFVFFSKKI